MKRIVFITLVLTFFVNFGFGQQKKFQISVFGGVHHVFEYGSEEDYELGENDFPVTPAHQPLGFGAAFAFFLIRYLGIELDGRYILNSRVNLQDPSDMDRVEINSSKHYSMTLSIMFQFLERDFRPYVVAGGGLDKVLAKDETLTSEYGYEITFIAPEKKNDPVIHVGTGIHYSLGKRTGLRMDIRYVVIFCDPDKIESINFVFGAFMRF